MAKTKNNVQMPAGIRNKLMAAVAMLMISCVMLITSTYAWFTLSTAPEVSNIDTTIAGNGSLEIALMPTTGDLTAIKSGKGTSSTVQDVTLANISWGNLVDLSDVSYGLNKIELMPAKITNFATGYTSILNTAVYGNDGRVKEVSGSTVLKSYSKTDGFTTASYGVRAIGDDAVGVAKNQFQTYGYIIDIALRSNVTTDLHLQTEGVERIYTESNSQDSSTTKGGGTTFTVNDDNVSKDLLSAIRFTFVENLGNKDNSSETVLGTARLITNNKNGTPISGPSYNLEFISKTQGADTEGNTTEVTSYIPADEFNLTSLTENVAKQISVIVWLDGSAVQSDDFAISGATLNASLNLQFSTDATLVPATNTKLKNTSETSTGGSENEKTDSNTDTGETQN